MANIDNLLLNGLGNSVTDNTIFRLFINGLQPNKLEDSSFIELLYGVDSSVLVSSNFTAALKLIHGRDDDIITNGEFSDAISVMDTDFLKSREFYNFISEFNTREELDRLESRENFSFSGMLSAEYFKFSTNLSSDVLENAVFDGFINSVDLGVLSDSSFLNFIENLDGS